ARVEHCLQLRRAERLERLAGDGDVLVELVPAELLVASSLGQPSFDRGVRLIGDARLDVLAQSKLAIKQLLRLLLREVQLLREARESFEIRALELHTLRQRECLVVLGSTAGILRRVTAAV